MIGIVGNSDSYLAQQSDFVLFTGIEEEACPNNLAPTTSTTIQMAMGDAWRFVCLRLVDLLQNHLLDSIPEAHWANSST